MHGRHVLQRRDAGFERLQRADQHAHADFLARPLPIVRRHGVQEPRLERHRCKRALEQRVVRVVMRRHQAGNREEVSAVNDLRRGRRLDCAHVRNSVAVYRDVPHRRLGFRRERIEHARAAHEKRNCHITYTNSS
jgi:hypothetical protein